MRSVDLSRFGMVPRSNVPRSAFDLEHTHKTTFDSGYLIPVLVQEILPGDSLRLRMSAFARLATPLVPVMDNMYLESFFFFVPYRLLWEHWENFMGEKTTPSDVTEYLIPQYPAPGVLGAGVASLADYFGCAGMHSALSFTNVSALPFRAYNLIWNEFFRDQDLQDPIPFDIDDGPDNTNDYIIRRRGKRHDYFTSARPWPEATQSLTAFQSTAFNPLAPGQNFNFPAGAAPVSGIGTTTGNTPSAGGTVATPGGRNVVFNNLFDSTVDTFYMEAGSTLAGAATQYPNVRVLINDIRTANMIQVMLERQARGGKRYTEIVRDLFGVVPPDFRLQRPEYLGGGRSPVTINPVAQTSASEAGGTVLGELAGVGTVVGTHGFSQSFTEHGVVLGLVNVRADITYQQGIERMWFRRSRYDIYQPPLAHLGEQAVISREIYCDGTGNNTGQGATVTGDFGVWGYVPRWEEYRYKPSRVSGRFRSVATSSLDVWHLAQEFGSRPSLNDAFIQDTPPVDRVLQVGGEDYEEFLFDSLFQMRMVRPMPMFSIPGLGPRL